MKKPLMYWASCAAAIVAFALAASAGAQEPPKDGLTEDERIEMAENLSLEPTPSKMPGSETYYTAKFFDFGGGPLEPGYTRVTPEDLYTKARGWGWILDPAKIVATKIRPRPHYSVPYGYPYIGNNVHDLFRDQYDIFTPLETDMISTFRRMGIDIQGLPDPGDVNRTMNGAQYSKDDIETDFAVDLPNGEYSILVEINTDDHYAFSIQAEGENPYEFQFRGNPKTRFMYVPVSDGQLNLKFICNRARASHNNGGIWGLGPAWNIAYVAIFDARDEEGFFREDWRIIKNKFYAAKKAIYVNVNRVQQRIADYHIVNDERPFWTIDLKNHDYPPFDKYLKFYSLGNDISGSTGMNAGLKRLFSSNNFLSADRHEKSYYEDYPFEMIDTLNTAYREQFFGRPFFEGAQLEFMPKYLQGESPLMNSPDGRSLGRAPLGSSLQRELIKEFIEFLAAHMCDHPSLSGYELWEELEDLPAHFGYDKESTSNYDAWLMKKYGAIDRLNAAWGTKYNDFSDIKPPPYAEFGGADYVNWQNFRGWVIGQDLKLCRDKIQEVQPWTLAIGGGSRPTTGDECTWDWLPAVDITFQYGIWLQKLMYPAQKYYAALRTPEFPNGHMLAVQSKTVESGGSSAGGTSRNCPYANFFSGVYRKSQSLPGRRKSPYRTPEETQVALDSCNGYNSIVHGLFHGMKAIEWEAQEAFGDTHMIHFAKWYRDVMADPLGEFRNEYNDLIFFAPEALEGPDVRICLPFLAVERANEMIYRLSPLLMPAQPIDADVGILALAESTFPVTPMPYTNGLANFRVALNNISLLLDSIQVMGWGIREDAFTDISKYRVLIVSNAAAAITKDQAEKLKQFVAKGGYLIFINNACTEDGDTLFTQPLVPLWGLDQLAGGKLIRSESGQITELMPGQKEGQDVGYEGLSPYNGTKVLAKDDDVVTAMQSADGKCTWIYNKKFGQGYVKNVEKDLPEVRKIMADVMKAAGVKGYVTVEGAASPASIYAGVLKGQDSWTFAISNNSLKDQNFTLKINCLPPGNYSVLDVTGQRPMVQFTKEKSWFLVKDPSYYREKFLETNISSQDLATKGLKMDCLQRASRILLVRDVKTDVWVNMPEYEIVGQTYQFHRNPGVDKRLDARPEQMPVRIVLPSSATDSQTKAASEIQQLLAGRKIKASVVKDSEVKIKKTHTEVKVPTRPGGPVRGVRNWYVMDVFDNEIVDTDGNLIVIGNENNNSLLKQLGKEGAFAYDKVMVKVTDSFPGKGVGVIQVVESINNEGYDPRHESRQAILVGGSDDASTAKALDRFLSVLRAHKNDDAKVVGAQYGFGKEKRPFYVKPKRKKPATAPATAPAPAVEAAGGV